MEYDLKSITKRFFYHSEEFEKNLEIAIKKWESETPSEKMPQHLSDPFNFAKSMHEICCILAQINKKLE
jgi:hypothetical protein